ncbi:MAG: phosphatidylserine decarboxylase, partial [Bacteroidales bacterium]|nr:phosphatidylserine decarboxylase [Bacteroidales bacterium]
MSIHKEGYKIILFGFILLLLFNVLINILISDNMLLKWILGIGSTALFLFLLFFFRLPARKIEPDPGLIYAPADGKVVVIEETEEKEYFRDQRLQVSIFMSPFNMHSNRYPVSGKVKYVGYHPGH